MPLHRDRLCDEFPSFVDLLQWRAAEARDRRAYLYLAGGEREAAALSFAELDARARSFAAWLQTFADPGDTAVLLYPSGLDFVVALFGCLYAGVIAIPTQPPEGKRLTRAVARLGRIVEDARPRAVLTTQAIAASLREAEGGALVAQWGSPLHAPDCESQAMAASWRKPVVGPDAIAHLQYTSGTTSAPRGTMISHRNLLVNSQFLRVGWGYTDDSVDVVWVPNYHDDGLVHGLLQPIYGGTLAVVMPPTAVVQDPLRWLQVITRYRATHSGGPNFIYDYCLDRARDAELGGLDLASWRCAYNAAEQIRKATLDRFVQVFGPRGFRWTTFCPSYGMAETTLLATRKDPGTPPAHVTIDAEALASAQRIAALPAEREGEVGTQTLVGCGQVVEDTRLVIVDPTTLAPCAADRVGEIWIANECVAAGYWNQPDATRATFHARPAGGGDGPSYLRTGDLGFVRDGQLYVTGRLKEMIIIRGQNYYPHDVLWATQHCHPRLRAGVAAAFAIEVDDEERLVADAEVLAPRFRDPAWTWQR